MKTKCIYVVASDSDDIYLEQTYLSAFSLNLHNPNANITLVVDEKTEHSLLGKRKGILNVISDICTVKCPEEYSKMAVSRFLKTSLRQHVEGDYLFIDGDTIITDRLDSIDNFYFDIGACIDKHLNISNHTQKANILTKAKQIKWDVTHWDGRYFNSGIMYVKESPIAIELYDKWHYEWKSFAQKRIYIDQPSLNKINMQMGGIITEIGGEWNCQIIENGIKYLNRAKIIHYFASSRGRGNRDNNPFLFKSKDLYSKIKNNGITEDIKEMLSHPKDAFSDKVRLVDGSTSDFLSSPIGRLARSLDNKIPSLNKALSKIIRK